jgi:hypothetical protein
MDRNDARKLAPIIQAWVDGKVIQYRDPFGEGWKDVYEAVGFQFPADHYRIKPAQGKCRVALLKGFGKGKAPNLPRVVHGDTYSDAERWGNFICWI